MDEENSSASLVTQARLIRTTFQDAFIFMQSESKQPISIFQFKSEMQRFSLWATNLGLFAPGHGSLDFRLRENDIIRSYLLELLKSLHEAVSEILLYLKETNKPNPNSTQYGSSSYVEQLQTSTESELQPNHEESSELEIIRKPSPAIPSKVKESNQSLLSLYFEEVVNVIDQIFEIPVQIESSRVQKIKTGGKNADIPYKISQHSPTGQSPDGTGNFPVYSAPRSQLRTATKPVKKVIREENIPGIGLYYVYEDGTRVRKTIDKEAVNANWGQPNLGITTAGKPRKRLAIACITCREKKIKCEPAEPKCVQCEKSGRECRFQTPRPVRRSKPMKGHEPTAQVERWPDLDDLPKNGYGLQLIYTPSNPALDVIFIHGLGGKSITSWCLDSDIQKFWPARLYENKRLKMARIHAFGYKPSIRGRSDAQNIFEFALNLLSDMKHAGSPGARIGSVPIVFVAHSMGGLVAKRAFLSGIHDNDFNWMMSHLKAIIFFSTPHYSGEESVGVFSSILDSFGFGKDYIRELSLSSSFLQSINHDFSRGCDELKLFSFYETEKTIVLGKEDYIVPMDRALPNERRIQIPGDHHSICRFENSEDSRFHIFEEILSSFVNSTSYPTGLNSFEIEVGQLSELLEINENEIADDYDSFQNVVKHGTCEWVHKREWFNKWLIPGGPELSVLWMSGHAGVGKSVLAASIVDKIRQRYGQYSCQYHNFSCDDRRKRSASYLLRSLAFQIGQGQILFRRRLAMIAHELNLSFKNMNVGMLWDKIFAGLLFTISPQNLFYWVIDGLEESDSIALIFECLRKVAADFPLRILLVSGSTPDKVKGVKDLPLWVSTQTITLNDNQEDIQLYVEDMMQTIIPTNEKSRQSASRKVVGKANGNFLWASLVMKQLKSISHSESEIQKTLTAFPEGLEPLYDGMRNKLSNKPDSDRKLAVDILQWALFSFRPLKVRELRVALQSHKHDPLINLEDNIRDLCGDFLQVRKGKLLLVHETAKRFLADGINTSKVQISASSGHEQLAQACLYLLSSKNFHWKAILKDVEENHQKIHVTGPPVNSLDMQYPFLRYASRTWSYHLRYAPPDAVQLDKLVREFLTSDFLIWLNIMLLYGDLKALVQSARWLKAYVKRKEKHLYQSQAEYDFQVQMSFWKQWPTDLLQVVRKFGSNLLHSPASIYRIIPPFCPGSSMIQKYYTNNETSFSVIGITNQHWDDCHARLSMDTDFIATKVVATNEVVAALQPKARSVVVWNSETYEDMKMIQHNRRIIDMVASDGGDLLCTSDHESLSIWELRTGARLTHWQHPYDGTKAIALSFSSNDEQLLVGFEDRAIICYKWRIQKVVFSLTASSEIDPAFRRGLLTIMRFSPDGSQVALGSRSQRVEVWDLQSQTRTERLLTGKDAPGPNPDYYISPKIVGWHPNSERLYVLYNDTRLVDWNPLENEHKELSFGHKTFTCSPCGSFLLTCDDHNVIKVLSLPNYATTKDRKIRLLYQLKCDGIVQDIAFHPEGYRFFDLRRSSCNVWEPEVLTQPDDSDSGEDNTSNSESSLIFKPAKKIQDYCSRVTAIAKGPKDEWFCCGRDDGTLSINDMNTALPIHSLSDHTSYEAIIALHWSRSKKLIASADKSGRVIVRKVQIPTRQNPKPLVWKASADFRIENSITRLLISPDDEYLLVSCVFSFHIWNFSRKSFATNIEYPSSQKGIWAQHPSVDADLLFIIPTKYQSFQWNGLDNNYGTLLRLENVFQPHNSLYGTSTAAADTDITFELSRTQIGDLEEPRSASKSHFVKKTVLYPDHRSILVQTASNRGSGRNPGQVNQISLIKTDLDSSADGSSAKISFSPSFKELRKHISRLIGVVKYDIIFLDHQNWLCTWNTTAEIEAYRRHLFFPRDWLDDDTIQLITVTEYGTLLVPKNGEVAIVADWMHFYQELFLHKA